MFDTKIIGKKIAALRKAKDMTQMELADQMFVSYQAVSNWERGNTMPDISKLMELSQILGVNVEELLGSEKETTIVSKIIDQSDDLNLEEVAEVVELMKPSQVEEAGKGIRRGISAGDTDRIGASSEFETAGANDRQDQDQRSVSAYSLAPFLESSQLASMIDRQHGMTGSFDKLIALAPFLDEDDLSSFAERLFNSEKGFPVPQCVSAFYERKNPWQNCPIDEHRTEGTLPGGSGAVHRRKGAD